MAIIKKRNREIFSKHYCRSGKVITTSKCLVKPKKYSITYKEKMCLISTLIRSYW